VAVARSVERRQHFGGEPAGFAQHDVEVIVADVLVKPVGPRLGEPRRVLEAEDDILDRRPVGHDFGVLRLVRFSAAFAFRGSDRELPAQRAAPATKACVHCSPATAQVQTPGPTWQPSRPPRIEIAPGSRASGD